jgi:uncharacterized membrane-anchored protein YhcB (DUF1043 family)
MEITSFILGVCAVIVIMMVVGTLVNYMTIKSLKEELNAIQKELDYIQLQIDKQTSELYDFGDTIDRNRISEQEKLYRHIDSRVDKAVDNLNSYISDVWRQLDKLENEGKSVTDG